MSQRVCRSIYACQARFVCTGKRFLCSCQPFPLQKYPARLREPEANTLFRALFTMSSTSRLPIEIPEISFTGIPALEHLKFHVVASLDNVKADLLAVALRSSAPQDDKSKPSVAAVDADYDRITGGALNTIMKRHNFSAAEGKTALVYLGGPAFLEAAALGLGSPATNPFAVLEGFEAPSHICCGTASKAGRALGELVTSSRPASICISIQAADITPCGLQALLEGYLLAVTPDDRYKSQKAETPVRVTDFYVHVANAKDLTGYKSALERTTHSANGIQLTRELLNAPANYCNTETLAKAAIQLAKSYGLQYKVLGEKECLEHKMGAYLSVHQGSLYEPQFIHLTYKPKGEVKKRIALIGKGVCMDTGGYNLKVNCGIETMKMDMGAAAAVFGAARMIGGVQPEGVEVHFIVAAAENMISARAYRPGDIVTASNGKTIEVGNTDAEGRLTLADALVYAEKVVKPDFILDCATLTGAIIIGLGSDIAAIYGTDAEWVQRFLKSSQATGSPLWPMPLFKPYRKLIDSKLADLSNTASVRTGGSITAALFLKEFVEETPWCHIDMAGPVYDNTTKEGTGYGAKLLAHAVLSVAGETKP